MTPLRIAITGCCGRMGRAVIRLAALQPDLRLVAAVTEPGDPAIGSDAGLLAAARTLNVSVGTDAAAADALIDFTAPRAAVHWARWCVENRVAFVSGTTGLGPEELAQLDQAARAVPVLWSPNMSIGINVLAKLVEDLARRLDSGWDVEIIETHHRHKADAPSGTARLLLERVCAARGVTANEGVVHGRLGDNTTRKPGEIGVHALRLGGVVGDHLVAFASESETLTLAHHAGSRDIFAAGALRAARWLSDKPPGRYTMQDLLA